MGHQPDKEVDKMIELLQPDGGGRGIDKMNEMFIEADVEDTEDAGRSWWDL
jgi:hypothetical protein